MIDMPRVDAACHKSAMDANEVDEGQGPEPGPKPDDQSIPSHGDADAEAAVQGAGDPEPPTPARRVHQPQVPATSVTDAAAGH